MAYIIILILLFAVVYLVSEPFRRRAFADAVGEDAVGEARPTELIELEAARDAKYREIRDAELDRQTGKLSEQDFEAIDSTLRAEAVALLRAIDDFHARRGGVDDPDAEQRVGEDQPAASGGKHAAAATRADGPDRADG